MNGGVCACVFLCRGIFLLGGAIVVANSSQKKKISAEGKLKKLEVFLLLLEQAAFQLDSTGLLIFSVKTESGRNLVR